MEIELKKTTQVLMLVYTGLIELIQIGLNFIPFIGNFFALCLSIVGWLSMFLWFKYYNISIFNLTTLICMVIEGVPVGNDLPGLFGGTARILQKYNIERISKKVPGGRIIAPIIGGKIVGNRNGTMIKNNSKVVTINKKPQVYSNNIKKVA